MSSRPDPTPAPAPAPSGEKRRPYPFDQIEPKWQRRWADEAVFHAPNPGEPGFDPSRPKFYVLDMFPYPSGTGLHVGHPEGYTATDILARYKRLRGFNVLHPMGWDAFGLPAEQYAIRTGQHPRVTTERNVAYFKTQLTRLGFDYDWQREVNTTDPGYFKWTQWIFRLLYDSWFDPARRQARPVSELIARRQAEQPAESPAERRAFVDAHRLAYVAEAPVNWCPELGTVLANEEVIDGKSEVGGFPVERRPMRQWMLRITAYADRLSEELDGLDWPDSIKRLQRNWIGRSEGAQVRFVVADAPGAPAFEVFTTRPDTLFGATFLVLSPEHPLVGEITAPEQRAAVAAYRAASAGKSDLERTDLAKEKTGVPTGAFAVNPVNGERLPVWIADYVLMGYGTGAIMAVPAHDERDWEFARRFGLPVRFVVRPADAAAADHPDETRCFAEHERGVAVNSGFLDGLPVAAAKARVTAWLEERGQGRLKVNYKLRDWLFSRQRYWGEPFPIVWRDGCHEAVAEGELPVLPPELDDFKPAGTPEPPLARVQEWVRYSESARRETNTMPQWAGSCWYYLRFCDPRNPDRFVGAEAERYWMTGAAGGPSPSSPAGAASPPPVRPGGVDLYVGGTEHAVLHLLYARFWHKVLCDRGYVSTPEPFQRLVNQGLILGEDGQKMSKRFDNVVNPLEVVADYGADSLRLFEMFMGPLEQTKPWSTAGVQGVFRFLARVWRVCLEEDQEGRWQLHPAVRDVAPTPTLQKVVHATIKKVTADIEALSFNTAISEMMVCVNALTNAPERPVSSVRLLLRILNPFAPHLTEELHERLNGWFPDPAAAGLLARGAWPEHDERWLVEEEVEIPVQINGKVRDRITVRTDATAPQTEAAALAAPKIREAVEGRRVVKVIVLPGKLVNVVVAP